MCYRLWSLTGPVFIVGVTRIPSINPIQVNKFEFFFFFFCLDELEVRVGSIGGISVIFQILVV